MSSKNSTRPKAGRPKVSVLTIAYNQEQYIRQTLDSLVMQQTDFDFEIVIADDCSSDKTADIIREYTADHPELFKTNLRTKNIGSWQNFLSVIRAARGDYITLCEGDDYWTDPHKLQRQADFLDSHPADVLCFHPVKVVFEDGSKQDYIYPDPADGSDFTTQKLLKRNFIQTNSVMYRRQDYDGLPDDIIPGDWYLHLYHARFGAIGFINEVMAVYRVHAGGLWHVAHANRDKLWLKYGLSHLNLYYELLKLYGKTPAYRKALYQTINDTVIEFIAVDKRHGSDLVVQTARQFPEAAANLIMGQQADIRHHQDSINSLAQTAENLTAQRDELARQLNSLLGSKSYKAARTAAALKSKLTGKEGRAS